MKTFEQIEKIKGLKIALHSEKGGCGEISILGTRGTIIWTYEDQHVSFSPMKKTQLPTWYQMCELKDLFYDAEEEAFEIHPKKSEYVNFKSNCLHLWGGRLLPAWEKG